MCVFYQYLIKEASSRRSPLCLSDGDEFTKEGFKLIHLSRIHSMMLSDFICVLLFDDLFVIIVDLFYLP